MRTVTSSLTGEGADIDTRTIVEVGKPLGINIMLQQKDRASILIQSECCDQD